MKLSPLTIVLLALLPCLTRAQDPQPAPAPFENEIKAFEQADKTNAPPKDAVLFLGSSSIRLWKTLKEDFPTLTVINRGFGGSHVEHSLRYANKIVLPYRPKLIVFYAGDNDLASGKSPNRVVNDFKTFAARVRSELPDTRILYISIRPSVARWHLQGRQWLTNQMIRDFAESDPTTEFVDVVPTLLDANGRPRADYLVADKLHLNDTGYRAWTATIRPHVERAASAGR